MSKTEIKIKGNQFRKFGTDFSSTTRTVTHISYNKETKHKTEEKKKKNEK